MLRNLFGISILFMVVTFSSCNSRSITSSTTGWPYDYKEKMLSAPPEVFFPDSSGDGRNSGLSFTVDDADEYETVNRRIRPNELNTRRTLTVNSFTWINLKSETLTGVNIKTGLLPCMHR